MTAIAFWTDLTPSQKSDLIATIFTLYDVVKEREEGTWSEAKAENTLNLVEAVVFLIAMGFVKSFGGPMASTLLTGARAVQKYWMQTDARERTAEHVHAWLEKRGINDNAKKVAFALFLWLTGTDISDAFGKAIDNWSTPFSAWLSLYGWAYLEADIGGAVSPVPTVWGANVLTGPVLGQQTAPVPDQWGTTAPPITSSKTQGLGGAALLAVLLAVPFLMK